MKRARSGAIRYREAREAASVIHRGKREPEVGYDFSPSPGKTAANGNLYNRLWG